MTNTRIAIIDSGFSENSEYIHKLSESYVLSKENEELTIMQGSPVDYIGHGTAIGHIICTTNKDVEIVCFRICDSTMDVDEEGLLYVLEYINDNITVDMINISAGVTYLFKYKELNEVCNKLYQKGVTIVSAFDNDGAISYPAAFDKVIGVATREEYKDRNDIYYVNNSIIDVFVPNIYYRTMWKDTRAILKGSSFASAKIVGMLSQNIKKSGSPVKKTDLLKTIATDCIDLKADNPINVPSFDVKRAIVFPVNKESHALLKFKGMLKFEIAGVYDERLSGNVGKNLYGENIKSFDSIDWNDNFDTVILSCTTDLSGITKREYSNEVVEMARLNNKNIYTFEQISSDYERVFYPSITPSMVPSGNFLKLHKVTLPVVGVFGTSSKQGKFTLQLEIIRRLGLRGYNVGHISTEPSGYLFDADYVFHFGYHSYLKIQPWESISILNHMVWETQLKGKDILITGCQSGTLHYNNSEIEHFAIYQYAFALGTMPDLCILSVNPHDEIEYIQRTIGFINSIDEGKVCALVVFPVQAIETLSGIKYKTKELSQDEMLIVKDKLYASFDLPVYGLGDESDMEALVELVISYFGD